MEESVLVSIGVITYNSEDTVIETLESIKNQTYKNIELIVSDDGSTDNTVVLCRDWIKNNADRFARTELIVVEKNTGTAANCNRRNNACRGQFIKGIAGDDLLEPTCIQVNLDNIGDADLAVSDMIYFEGDRLLSLPDNSKIIKALTELSPKKRTKLYCRTFTFFNPPSIFINKSLIDKVGPHDEKSGILEDTPYYLRIFKSDCKLVYIPQKTVRYRSGGISHDPKRQIRVYRMVEKTFYECARPYLSAFNPIDLVIITERWIKQYLMKDQYPFLMRCFNSRYNPFQVILRRFATYLL